MKNMNAKSSDVEIDDLRRGVFEMGNHWIKTAMALFVLSALASCATPQLRRPPELKTVAPFDAQFGTSVLEFCEQNYGAHIAKIVETEGYVDSRTNVGCSQDCLRDFLWTGVSFVEVEILEGHEGRTRQPGLWASSYRYFPLRPGIYKHYEADSGDPACAAFEAVADQIFRNRIGLPDGRCIATQKQSAFSAEFEVENVFVDGELLAENFKPEKYSMSSTVIRHRRSGEITAENSGVNFTLAAADKDETSNHSGDAHLTCLSDFPSSFLRNAIDPLE